MSEKERQNANLELEQELFDLEQQLGMSLEDYDVEYPSESEIMQTIDAIRPYVPKKDNKWETLVASVSTVMKHSTREVFYFSPLFWSLNLLFVLLSVLSVFMYELNPYRIVLYIAPLPTIIGLMEVFKSKNTSMAELEMSFKYSLQEIILSRIVVVGAFNIVLNLLLTICFAMFLPEVIIGKLILYWATPFTVIAAIMLFIASKFRQAYTLTGGLVLWTGTVLMLSQREMLEQLEAISAFVYIFVTVVAVIYIVFKMSNIYKRGISFDFNG